MGWWTSGAAVHDGPWIGERPELTSVVGISSLPGWHMEQEGGAGNLLTGSPGAERR
jgi:hypothetical protein